jgi:hypothetical protein
VSAGTFAQIPSAMIAVTTYDRLDKARPREAILRELSERVGVAFPARKELFPRKPHKRQAVGAIMLSLYQFADVRHSQHHGVMVVFTTDLPSNAAVIGLAFVANDDKHRGNQAVLHAIESLSPPEVAGPAPERVPKAGLPTSSSKSREPTDGSETQSHDVDPRTLK